MKARKLACPKCGSTPDDGVEFLATEPTRGEQSYIVGGQDDDGNIIFEPVDHDSEATGAAPTIYCRVSTGGCGHEWVTRRAFVTRAWAGPAPTINHRGKYLEADDELTWECFADCPHPDHVPELSTNDSARTARNDRTDG